MLAKALSDAQSYKGIYMIRVLKKISKISLLLIFYLFSSLTAHADDALLFQQGQAAYSEKDYTKAMEIWLPLALSGMVDAQGTVAFLYSEGLGTPQNIPKAIHWYKRAAEQGSLEAKYHLGIHYERGDGVEKDVGRAEAYFREALCGGYSYAIVGLVSLYKDGHLNIKDQQHRESIEAEIIKLKDPGYKEYLIQKTRDNWSSKKTRKLAGNSGSGGCS